MSLVKRVRYEVITSEDTKVGRNLCVKGNSSFLGDLGEGEM